MASPAAVLSIIVEANTSKAKAELDRFNKGLDDKSIKVTATIDKTSFARAKQVAGSLGGVEEVKLKADVDTSSFARARAAMKVLSSEGDNMGGVFDRSNLSIGHWTGILAAALPVIVDMTGALGALTASAAAATAGLGALGVGLGGVAAVGFGGIAAIAVPAIKSLKDLMTAQTAHNKAVTTGAASAGRAASASAQQIQSANQAVTASEQQLKVAQESELVAQKALTLARKDAVRQLQDMKRAALESGTSEKRAHLSLLQAEKNLRDLRTSGTATGLDLRDAELSVTEARQNQKDVSIQANRAQADFNKAQKKGIDQMPGVVSAQQSLDSASRGVADAQRAQAQATQNLAFQQKQANAATAAGGTSLAALQLAQKKAGPAAVKFAHNLKDISHQWKELTKAGKADFFGMLNDGLKRTQHFLPLFAQSAESSMKALRDGMDLFLAKITGPGFKDFIHTMTVTFAKGMKPIAAAFGNIGIVLERIAVAVAPDILRMVKGFRGMTQDWVDATDNAGKLRDTVHELVNQANTWWKLIKATAGLIAAVLIPGMGQGKKAVEGITASIKGWTDWVNAHPAEMRDFFKQGLETTKQLAQVLLGFLPMIFQISKAMRPIARLFLGIVKALNSLKIGNVSALTVLLGAMVSAKLVSGLTGLIGTFKALKTAALGAATAEASVGAAGAVPAGPAPKAMGLASSAPVIAPTGIKALAADTATLAKFAKVAGVVGLAVTTIIGAFEALRTNFLGVRSAFVGFFDKVLKPLGGAMTELINTVSGGHAAQVFGAIGAALKAIAKPLGFVLKNVTKLMGLFAIAAVAQPFIFALTAIATTAWVAIKALTFLVKALKRLGDVATVVGKVLIVGFAKAWSVVKDIFRSQIRNTLDTFRGMAGPASTIAKAIGGGLKDTFTKAWGKIKDVFTSGTGVALGAFKRFGGGIHDIANGIGHTFRGLYLVIKKVASWIGNQVNKVGNALGGLKDKIPNLGLSIDLPSIPGFQRGGLIGGAGDGDKVPAMLEPGEGVINKKAVKRMGGKGAVDAINQAVPRFAGGGFVGMQPGITKLAKTMIQRFGGYMSSGVRPGDPGFHGRGMAADIVPSKWGAATRYANQVGPQLLEGIHQGPPGTNVSWDSGHKVSPSFWGSSTWANHVSHIHLAVAGAVKGAIAGAASQIGKIKIKGKGPGAEIAQLAANKMRADANRVLAKLGPKASTDTALLHGDGNVERVFARVAKKLSKSKTATLALGEAGFAESGMRDLSYGDKTSQGALQLLSTTASSLGVSPHDEGAIASIFFTKGFTGRGGANALAAQGLPAHLVAQGVQGSADSSGSNYATQIGPAKGWMRRFGLQKGGVVGPYVGSFAQGGEVAKTGLAHVHKGEQVVSNFQQGGLAGALQTGGTHHIGPFGHVSGLTHAEQIKRHIGALGKQIGKLDERIDIAQQLAGLSTSPGGTELSKGELTKQIALERRLLDTLRKTLAEAKKGMRVTQKAIDRHPERIDRIRDKIKRERTKKNPDQKQIATWLGEIKGERAKHDVLTGRMKGLQQTFHQTVVDMSGLTGKGGRIFDTALALKELKATVPAGAAGLHIQELLEFAEAMRYGAFKLPTFAKGGVVPGPLGQAQAIIAHGGERVTPASASGPAPHVEITFADGMGWLRQFMQVEIKGQERRTASRYRAGVRP